MTSVTSEQAASCPAFTITTNGGGVIRQIVQEILALPALLAEVVESFFLEFGKESN
jgi:hypothetical protein